MADGQPQSAIYSADLLQSGQASPRGEPQAVSVAGVLLLSAVAVVLAILSVVVLGGIVTAAWWLVSRIPVPMAIKHLLALL